MFSTVFCAVKTSFLSRLAIFALQLIFNLVPDHNADAFDPEISNASAGLLDEAIRNSLDGFHKWDAKYFLHVAKHGYEEERMCAFFPLFPILLRISATALFVLSGGAFSTHSYLLLSGALLNTAFFIGAAMSLYRLTVEIYRDVKFALLCAVLFSFNPASIFFSANYTEALYAFCVFRGLYHLKRQSHLEASMFLAAASATRSNGIVNLGFIAYFGIQDILFARQDFKKMFFQFCGRIIWIIIRTLLCAVTVLSPFVLFNMYGYYTFCKPVAHSQDGTFTLPEWCLAKMPLIYSHVQNKNWDVGFLAYYQIRKIPNIILGMPCAFIVLHGVIHFLSNNADLVKSLGLQAMTENSVITRKKLHVLRFANHNIFVFMVHAMFLLLFGLCFMHVEVITRLLFSSTPVPIWVVASFLLGDVNAKHINIFSTKASYIRLKTVWQALSLHSKVTCVYFMTYIVVGTFMHVNFLPWT